MKNWTCVFFLHETCQSGPQRKLFSLDEAGFMPHPQPPSPTPAWCCRHRDWDP